MKSFYEEEVQRRLTKDAQSYIERKHHYVPTIQPVFSLNRYDRAFAEKGMINSRPSIILIYEFQQKMAKTCKN